MCPEFEREEREYQKNVDRWEMVRQWSAAEWLGAVLTLVYIRPRARTASTDKELSKHSIDLLQATTNLCHLTSARQKY